MTMELTKCNQQRSESDQRDTQPIDRGQLLAEERRAEYCDQNHAQLVDRRDAGGVAELEGAKIAEP